MIHLTLGATQDIYATLKEKRQSEGILGVYYLLSFTHDTTGEVVNHKAASFTATNRITTIPLTEGSGAGEINLGKGGSWSYTIYEDTNVSNTDPAAASVVKVLETGKALVAGGDEVTYSHHSPSTSNSVYIKI